MLVVRAIMIMIMGVRVSVIICLRVRVLLQMAVCVNVIERVRGLRQKVRIPHLDVIVICQVGDA